MNDFVTARAEYISADQGEVSRSDIRAHRITCMRNAPAGTGPGVLRDVHINNHIIQASNTSYDFEAGTKIEGFVITSFVVSTGNFLVEYLE